MDVNKYDQYLQEIQLLECKTKDPFKDNNLKGNYGFGYFENTDHLQSEALSTLPDISKRKIEQNLTRLKLVRTEFLKIEQLFEGLSQDSKIGEVTIDLLKEQLSPFELTCVEVNLIDELFLNEIYETILYRLHSLLELINKTEDYLAGRHFNQFYVNTENSPHS